MFTNTNMLNLFNLAQLKSCLNSRLNRKAVMNDFLNYAVRNATQRVRCVAYCVVKETANK